MRAGERRKMASESSSMAGWSAKDSTWVVIAKKKGDPRELRLLTGLGATKSAEEALERVQKIALRSKKFRARFSGWMFFAAEVSYLLELNADGLLVRWKNETKGVSA